MDLEEALVGDRIEGKQFLQKCAHHGRLNRRALALGCWRAKGSSQERQCHDERKKERKTKKKGGREENITTKEMNNNN
jgi:hypothetical protein